MQFNKYPHHQKAVSRPVGISYADRTRYISSYKSYYISGGWYEDIGVVEGEGTTRCGGAPGTGSDCVDAI